MKEEIFWWAALCVGIGLAAAFFGGDLKTAAEAGAGLGTVLYILWMV